MSAYGCQNGTLTNEMGIKGTVRSQKTIVFTAGYFLGDLPVFPENCSVPYTFALHTSINREQSSLLAQHEIFCRGQIRNRCGTQAGISARLSQCRENEKEGGL